MGEEDDDLGSPVVGDAPLGAVEIGPDDFRDHKAQCGIRTAGGGRQRVSGDLWGAELALLGDTCRVHGEDDRGDEGNDTDADQDREQRELLGRLRGHRVVSSDGCAASMGAPASGAAPRSSTSTVTITEKHTNAMKAIDTRSNFQTHTWVQGIWRLHSPTWRSGKRSTA